MKKESIKLLIYAYMIKAIANVFFANVIQLATTIIVGFVIPSILSVEGYANFKTYTLFLSYIGLLHLGFPDGMYLKYGGLSYSIISKNELKKEHLVFLIFQCFISLIFIVIGLYSQNTVLILLVFSILPSNLFMYFKKLFQSTGEFKIYSHLIIIFSLTNLILNLIFIFLFKVDNYILYCFINIFSNFIVCLIAEISFLNNLSNFSLSDTENRYLISNIKSGFFILLGNLSVNLFYAIDRWIVKIFFLLKDFAYYSFAVSMLNIVNVLINSISITFYNFLSKEKNLARISSIKSLLLVIGAFSSSSYFLLEAIIQNFLIKYNESLEIIAISFAAFPYIIVINAIYVNLYKINKLQKKYFSTMIMMIFASTLLNLSVVLFKNNSYIALMTTISYIIWYFISNSHFKKIVTNRNDLTFMFVALITFLLLVKIHIWFIGLSLYLFIISVFVLIIYKKKLKDILQYIKIFSNKL